jgi:regulatory protein
MSPNLHRSDDEEPDERNARPARERAKPSLKGRALAYLSRREYSRLELARKLTPHVEDGDDLDAVLDALEREGWLSDARFAQSLMHRRAARYGTSRVLNELKRHALDDHLVESLSDTLRDSEAERAYAVWQKKFGVLPTTPAERAKQTRFLAMRGFSHGIISRLLRGALDDFDDAAAAPDDGA